MSDDWRRRLSAAFSLGGATVGYDRLVRPDGAETGNFWADPPDAVAVVAVTEGTLVLIEEYRPYLRETVLTCPIGRIEGDESFVEAAARELREETGFEAGTLRFLGAYYPVSWLRKRHAAVFATDLSPGEQSLEPDEFVRVRPVPADRAIEVARREPATGWTLTPLLLAREEGHL